MARPTKTGGATFPLIDAKRSYRGLLTTPIFRGQRHIQAWPRKRGKPKSAVTLVQNAEFVRFVAAVNDMSPDDRIAAIEIAKGTPYTWRDVLSRAITGQLVEIDGGTLVDIQAALDGLTEVPGSLILRTTEGWRGLDPGGETQMLAVDGGLPAWVDQAGPGAATGLFNQVLSPIPTQAGTGLTTAMNASYVTPVVADGVTGLTISAASNTSRQGMYGLRKTAPSTGNKRVTALIALNWNWTQATVTSAIGYTDGTKLQTFEIASYNGTRGPTLQVSNWSGIQTYVTSPFGSANTVNCSCLMWMQLQDDGTNIKFRIAMDGGNFTEVFSVVKSSGYLGASGYSNIFFGFNPYASNGSATLLSYRED